MYQPPLIYEKHLLAAICFKELKALIQLRTEFIKTIEKTNAQWKWLMKNLGRLEPQQMKYLYSLLENRNIADISQFEQYLKNVNEDFWSLAFNNPIPLQAEVPDCETMIVYITLEIAQRIKQQESEKNFYQEIIRTYGATDLQNNEILKHIHYVIHDAGTSLVDMFRINHKSNIIINQTVGDCYIENMKKSLRELAMGMSQNETSGQTNIQNTNNYDAQGSSSFGDQVHYALNSTSDNVFAETSHPVQRETPYTGSNPGTWSTVDSKEKMVENYHFQPVAEWFQESDSNRNVQHDQQLEFVTIQPYTGNENGSLSAQSMIPWTDEVNETMEPLEHLSVRTFSDTVEHDIGVEENNMPEKIDQTKCKKELQPRLVDNSTSISTVEKATQTDTKFRFEEHQLIAILNSEEEKAMEKSPQTDSEDWLEKQQIVAFLKFEEEKARKDREMGNDEDKWNPVVDRKTGKKISHSKVNEQIASKKKSEQIVVHWDKNKFAAISKNMANSETLDEEAGKTEECLIDIPVSETVELTPSTSSSSVTNVSPTPASSKTHNKQKPKKRMRKTNNNKKSSVEQDLEDYAAIEEAKKLRDMEMAQNKPKNFFGFSNLFN